MLLAILEKCRFRGRREVIQQFYRIGLHGKKNVYIQYRAVRIISYLL